MASFERIDPGGDLNTGKSIFNVYDSYANMAQLSQEEAKSLMNWMRSFLDPLPSLHEQMERQRAIMAQLAALPIPVTLTMEHDNRGKPFYSWTVGTPGTPRPWGISAGATTEFHDAVGNALEQALKYAMRATQEREQDLRQIIDGLFQIAEPGPVKNSLWARYQDLDKE